MDSTGGRKKNYCSGKPEHKIEDSKKGLVADKKYLSGALIMASST
jgi:hypothetical protein